MSKPLRRDQKLHADSTQRERERVLAIEKTTRLRDLRMAKEAAEREVALRVAAEKAAQPKRKRRTVQDKITQDQQAEKAA